MSGRVSLVKGGVCFWPRPGVVWLAHCPRAIDGARTVWQRGPYGMVARWRGWGFLILNLRGGR